MQAAKYGENLADWHLDFVNYIIKKGAKLDEVNLNGETALMIAARHGKSDMVHCLIKHGAKLDAVN